MGKAAAAGAPLNRHSPDSKAPFLNLPTNLLPCCHVTGYRELMKQLLGHMARCVDIGVHC